RRAWRRRCWVGTSRGRSARFGDSALRLAHIPRAGYVGCAVANGIGLKYCQRTRRRKYRTRFMPAMENDLDPPARSTGFQRTDIDDAARAQLAGEKHILQLVATGVPLTEVLDALCRQVEALTVQSLCSILLVDQDQKHFRFGAGPSIPTACRDAIDGDSID